MLKNSWALFPVIVFLSEGKRSQHKPNRHGWKMLVPLNKSVTIEGSCACREHNHTDQRYSGGEQTPDTDFFCNNDGRGLGNFTRALSSVAEVTIRTITLGVLPINLKLCIFGWNFPVLPKWHFKEQRNVYVSSFIHSLWYSS